jgi:hypothetical protein
VFFRWVELQHARDGLVGRAAIADVANIVVLSRFAHERAEGRKILVGEVAFVQLAELGRHGRVHPEPLDHRHELLQLGLALARGGGGQGVHDTQQPIGLALHLGGLFGLGLVLGGRRSVAHDLLIDHVLPGFVGQSRRAVDLGRAAEVARRDLRSRLIAGEVGADRADGLVCLLEGVHAVLEDVAAHQ